jgi:molecular chaperone GrpE
MAEEREIPESLEDKAARETSVGNASEEKAGIVFPTPEEIEALGGKAGAGDESAEAPGEEAATEIDVDGLLEKAEQADEYFRRLQRLQAEFDNYRKRITRERAEQRGWAIRSLVEDLVDVVDGFERALHEDHASEVPTAYREGIEMVHRKLTETLARYGLSRLEAVGETFDPHFHEAVTQEPSDDYETGVILGEIKPGYLLGERLLRPAMVRVSAGPGPSGGEAGPQEG